MPKQDRGAPARPPWLPEEDEQRGFLRSLRRKKRNPDEVESSEDSLTHETETHETERASAPQAPAQKPIAESVASSVEERSVVTSPDEKANGGTPVTNVSKYYTPPRAPEPPVQQPLTVQSNAIAQTPVSEAPRIVTSPISEMKPESRPPSQVAQPPTPPPSGPPATPVPEPAADEHAPTPPEAEAPSEIVHSDEPVQVAARSEEASPPAPTADQRGAASGGTDPFSRFSLLEAQLRQMSLDESITDAELERHRRHVVPESEAAPAREAPGALRFTPPEAVDDVPDVVGDVGEQTQVPEDVHADGQASGPTLGGTVSEAIDDAPEPIGGAVSDTAEPEPIDEVAPDDEPAPAPAEPEPPAAFTADFVPSAPEPNADTVSGSVSQTPVAEESTQVSDEPSPVIEEAAESEVSEPSAGAPDVDDVDARAAALLQRIEAKRAELNEELAAHDAADLETPAPEPEPAPFVPMIAPWAAVPEPLVDTSGSRESESTEFGVGAEELAEKETTATAAPDLEGFAPLVDEDIVIDLPAVVFEETSAAPALEDVEALPDEHQDESNVPAARVEPEQSEPEHVAVPEPISDDVAVQEEPGHPNVPQSQEIPSAIQPAPAVEPPVQPAYYVPPPAPQQAGPPQPGLDQQHAAQAPPGWNPRQPYPGQWSQGAPEAPQPYGGQQLPQQPPPQPTSVEGQWQWVPQQQQPQAPQPPGPQDLPPGYLPPPQGAGAPANYRAPQAYRMPPSLDEAEVINRGRYAPRSGWRKAVHRSTGGRVNPGDSRKDREQEQLLASIRQPILGDYRIAVLSIKGGVGKTTTTLGLGSAFATIRTDRIIAVDANPDRGTLAERVRDHSTQSTVRDLLNDRNIRSYADVRNHTRMATSRLEVLASEQDPAVSEAFGEVDYRNTIDILQRYYNIILTDCGTGIMHSAMAGVLDLAHTIVLVSSPAMDSARSASATLDWLMQHGHSALVREAHVVLSASRPGSAGIKLDKVYEHFEARCRSIHMIPFDPHLAEGADVDFNLLNADTNAAYLKLAGAISESFPRLRMRGDEQR
ncbi:AAA family ATPase [Mycobacteroides salmoniphilum]|uniref:AAA family ATPase n=1 Tax=Mycobacteroides salmoniphilum TaxID=404941 RepID=UPI000993E79B|nr:AAA family ATPase [Mycobacteroides salmoniphilum]